MEIHIDYGNDDDKYFCHFSFSLTSDNDDNAVC